MSQEMPAQPPALDGRGQDIATGAYMARYDVARCQSVCDYLSSCDNIDSKPTINRETVDPSLLPDQYITIARARAGERIRTLVRFLNAACRWAYERVAL
jgi:hypothetical protein